MNCTEHKNEELANCPSCLAEYWEAQYTQVKAENARLRAVLDSLIRQVEPLLVSNGYAHIGAIEVARSRK